MMDCQDEMDAARRRMREKYFWHLKAGIPDRPDAPDFAIHEGRRFGDDKHLPQYRRRCWCAACCEDRLSAVIAAEKARNQRSPQEIAEGWEKLGKEAE